MENDEKNDKIGEFRNIQEKESEKFNKEMGTYKNKKLQT
jgi:hypothetical protein